MQLIRTTALALALLTATSAHAQIRRTSTDLSNEDILPTTGTSAPLITVGALIYLPSNIPPTDPQNWLECNGQPVPAGAKYDKLRAMVGATVPDYRNGQFLRPTTDASRVGTTVSDSIKSHTVEVPGQNATVTGALDSTTVQGVASQQDYSYDVTYEEDGAMMTSAPDATVGLAPWGNQHATAYSKTSGGTISGNVSNGHVTGVAAVQPTTGTYSGSSETAPIHSYVRTYIRAVQ